MRVTDPAGKWKIQNADALGSLKRVIEPNPSGGADWVTDYTYDVLGRLVGVSMPRSNGTQTRTFAYDAYGNLTSATNPENGTVSVRRVASRDQTDGRQRAGDELFLRYLWAAETGAALGERVS